MKLVNSLRSYWFSGDRMILLALLFTVPINNAAGENFGYALQRKPVTFIASPKSLVLSDQDDLTLYCDIRLWSRFPVILQWRHNNQVIQDSARISVHDSPIQNGLRSELLIHNVSSSDGGLYECLASDGIDEAGNAAMVTVSQSARVQILEQKLEYEITDVVKKPGQYVILSCDYNNSVWKKNGSILTPNSNTLVLTNGSLLIYNLTWESEGIYQCFYEHSALSGAYNLSLETIPLQDTDTTGHPVVLMDPADIVVSHEGAFVMKCCVLGLEFAHYKLKWSRRNGNANFQQVLWSYNSTSYCNTINISVPDQQLDVGTYEFICSVEDQALSSVSSVAVEELPVMSLHVKEETIFSALDKVTIDCPLQQGTNLTIKWYKNGVYISSSSAPSGGPQTLSYIREVGTSSVGIYQCFASNSVGSDYATARLVEIGFANPPEDLTCRAVDNDMQLPRIILTWSPPDFNTTAFQLYTVTDYSRGDSVAEHETPNTFYELDLRRDNLQATFAVFAHSVPSIDKGGVKEFCHVDTLERRYDPANVRAAEVICPTEQSSGNVSWTNPRIPFNIFTLLFLPLKSYHIECRCLHEDRIINCGGFMDTGADLMNNVSFPVESQPTNSLCIVGGEYAFRSKPPLTIPTEICNQTTPLALNFPVSEMDIECKESTVSVAVADSFLFEHLSIHVEGNCLLADIITTVYVNSTLSSNVTKVNISHTSLDILACSLVVSTMDVTVGIQCLPTKSILSSFELNLPVTTSSEDATPSEQVTWFTTKNPTKIASSKAAEHEVIVGAIVQIIVLVLLICFISLVISLLIHLKRKQKMRRKDMWHKAVQTVAEADEGGPHEHNVFASKTTTDDAVSIMTVCENLCQDKSAMEMKGNFLFSNFLYNKQGQEMNSDVIDQLWNQRALQPRDTYFCSSSSGYETQSDTYPESREYFIAREVELNKQP